MLWNYIKVAVRNLWHKKFYTLINITGLAVGLLCAILIGLYIVNELSYDKYNEDYERIFRLESHFTIQESDDYFAVTALPLAPAVKLEFPEDVEEYCRFCEMDNNLFQIDSHKFFEDNCYYADSTVFDLFSYEMILGNEKEALDDPNEIVLTESFAKKIFGNTNPLGKNLETGYGFSFTVTGVIKDLPVNSHLNFAAIGSMITLAQLFGAEQFKSLDPTLFWNVGFYSFVKLTETGSMDNIMAGYSDFNAKYIAPVGDLINSKFMLMSQRLDKIHLHSNLSHDQASGNIDYIYIFGIIAVFLLIIGCINYMNLATAQSAGRATEVGIRKAAGALRSSLQGQFIMESVITSILALILALFAVELLLPGFNRSSGMELSLNIADNLTYFFFLFVLTLLVGIISGSYPAFYLSSFKPAEVLKGKLAGGNTTLRKLLVIVQFSISIIMIIGTLGVMHQLNFIQTTDLGFNKENLIVLTIRDTSAVKNLDTFKDELLKHPNIISGGSSTSVPGSGYGIIVQRYEGNDGNMNEKAINFLFADYDYLETMDMKILEGRNFDPELQTDSQESILINQRTAEVLGWGDNAIGKKLDFGAGSNGEASRKTRVIGIVKDFNYASLHNPIDPLLILLSDGTQRNITLRIKQKDVETTLRFIEEKWNEFCPTFPFNYRFLDEDLQKQYESEKKTSRLFGYFTLICIFIACLGLFGLTAYTTERRIREIGIRKVLGASEASIIVLLTKNFAVLVLVSNIIAFPVAWFALQNWLENFAYSAGISIWIFLASGIAALLIAILTISLRALQAARSNPAESLKYE